MGRRRALVVAMALPLLGACSIRSLAIDALARSLAASGDVFASDEDPELIRQATPFALKTIETLLAEKPDHDGLALAACRGFTQYGAAFVEPEAERLEATDYAASERAYDRVRKLYLRALGYCLRPLDRRRPGVRARLESEPERSLDGFARADVPLLFWTAAAWGSAISVSLDRPEVTVDLPAVRALAERVEELDEGYERGLVHELLMALESVPETMGGSPERAREHFERAVELSGGQAASPYVGLAESVAVREQDRERFVELLEAALAVDPDAYPPGRLANLVAQERARRLLDRADELFL